MGVVVEPKLNDAPPDSNLRYLRGTYPTCPAWQVHADGTRDCQTAEGIRGSPALALLRTLV